MVERPRRRAADRVIRLPRAKPERVTVAPARRPRQPISPPVALALGFAALIALGTILLMLPASTAGGVSPSFSTALFTAASAVTVTGLVVVDTATYWSPLGHAVILALIQVGGLGFMSASTVLLLALGRRLSLRYRLLLREAVGEAGFGGLGELVKRIVLYTLIVELAGAVVLTLRFAQDRPLGEAAWLGVFHSVSAFNNAGFDLFPNYQSLTSFTTDAVVVLTMAALIILGGISYVVVADVLRARAFTRLSLTSKIVLSTSVVLWSLGTAVLLLTERSNPATLGGLPPWAAVMNAFFMSVTPRTAGFTTIDLGAAREESLFLLIALMFIGGASGSTAGGIKVNTFSVLFWTILSAIQGKTTTEAFQREIPQGQVLRALAIALISVALVYAVGLVLVFAEGFAFQAVFFEGVSAFGTVGLSTGITPSLSNVGRLVLVLVMFVGRLGPLTFVLAVAGRERVPLVRYARESVRIG